jgi:hypothetical protein
MTLVLLGALVACLAGAGGARGATGSQIVADLNQMRAAGGIPGTITEDPERSRGCALHTRYMALNQTVEHTEDPRLPGYTALGDRAASHSVLTGGGPWSAGSSFRQAPIHLMQMLNPRLSVSGADDGGGYVCVWTMPDPAEVTLPEEDVVRTFPGRGAQDVPTQETAREEPFVPGDFVGLPQGTVTGPHLYVLPDGPWAARVEAARDGMAAVAVEHPIVVEDAALRGPGGPVPLKVVDDRSDPRLTMFLPAGAILIPAVPLRPAVLYTAEVLLLSPETGVRRNHAWSFTTGARENSVRVTLERLRPRRGRALPRFRASVTTPAAHGRLALRAPGGRSLQLVLRRAGGERLVSRAMELAPGRWTVCARTGGPGTAYLAVERCLHRRVILRRSPPAPRRSALPRERTG